MSFLPCLWVRVLFELVHLGRGGGQAHEIDVRAANQRAAVGSRRARQPFLAESGKHEGVNFVLNRGLRPGTTGTGGGLTGWNAQCFRGSVSRPQCLIARVGRAGLDPIGECDNRLRRKRLLGRHWKVALAAHGADDLALGRFARDDDRLAIEPGLQPGRCIEPKSRVLLLLAVAGVAVLGQDRPDRLLEVLDLRGGGISGRRVRGSVARKMVRHHRSIDRPRACKNGRVGDPAGWVFGIVSRGRGSVELDLPPEGWTSPSGGPSFLIEGRVKIG